MELLYKNKKSEKEILEKASQIKLLAEVKEESSILIEGENFYAMSSLLDSFRGKIDLVYIDPPFNTNHDFVVSEDRANSISKKRDGKLAYSDKFTKEEFLEFLKERFLLIRELLSNEGSVYVHIDYKIGHYVKIIMDEVFGENNFKNDITRIKSNPKNFYRKAYGNQKDLILFYVKNKECNIWNDIKCPLKKSEIQKLFPKIDKLGRRYTTIPLHAPGETQNGITGKPWRDIPVPAGRHWRTNPEEFDKFDLAGDIEWSSTGNPRLKKYASEHKGKKIQDLWEFKDPQNPVYPTEKNLKMIEQIILQSSNENSIVMDCFAGSGTTLKAAAKHGRQWIGIDKSEIAVDLIRESNIGEYSYYKLST